MLAYFGIPGKPFEGPAWLFYGAIALFFLYGVYGTVKFFGWPWKWPKWWRWW